MHAVIGQFASENFYAGRLVHDESCAAGDVRSLSNSRTVGDIVDITTTATPDFPGDLTAALIFIDTAGLEFFETLDSISQEGEPLDAGRRRRSSSETAGPKPSVGADGSTVNPKVADVGSRLNEGEAGLAVAHIQNFVALGVLPEDIGCISPYSAQVRRLRHLLDQANLRGVECGSVDSFQGREKEVIVFSATRSSDMGGKNGIGFLAETRRFNVAVTRAKKSFTLIGDSATLASTNGHPLLGRFIDYVERRTLGDYRSGFSYAL